MQKRFQTYFGVPIPPFKEKKLGAGSTTIRFVVTGNVISKKNNNQAIAVRKPAIDFIRRSDHGSGSISVIDAIRAVNMVRGKMIGNTEYKKFLEKKKPIIQSQMQEWLARLQEKGLVFPLYRSAISIRLYIKDRYRRDTLNAMQTIQDLLVDAKVISDDNDEILNPIFGASARYYEELVHNIAFISLSFKLNA